MKITGKGILVSKEVETLPKKDGSGNWELTKLLIKFDNNGKDEYLQTKSFKKVEAIVNDEVDVIGYVTSREYNGKIYNDILLNHIEVIKKEQKVESIPSLNDFTSNNNLDIPF